MPVDAIRNIDVVIIQRARDAPVFFSPFILSSKLSLNGYGSRHRVCMHVCCVRVYMLYICLVLRVRDLAAGMGKGAKGTGLWAQFQAGSHPITDILYHSKHRDYLQ